MKLIVDRKEIQPEQLPDGSVVKYEFNESIDYAEIYTKDNTKFVGNKNWGASVGYAKVLEVYHIPGYQKMWLATDKNGWSSIFLLPPQRKTTFWENCYFELLYDNYFLEQSWKDEPHVIWEKINLEG